MQKYQQAKVIFNVIPIFLTEKAMAPHSSSLAWKIPWTEESGRLQSMGSLRVGHDWATSLSLFTFMHWRMTWQPTPVFLPGESQGWGAWWAAVYGVAQSRTWLKWLSSSSSSSNLSDMKSLLIRIDPDDGKDWRQEKKGMTEDEMVGWHHWLNGHEFEQAPGDSEGQGSLACCSPWGLKESDMTEWLNWTETDLFIFSSFDIWMYILLFFFFLHISTSFLLNHPKIGCRHHATSPLNKSVPHLRKSTLIPKHYTVPT